MSAENAIEIAREIINAGEASGIRLLDDTTQVRDRRDRFGKAYYDLPGFEKRMVEDAILAMRPEGDFTYPPPSKK